MADMTDAELAALIAEHEALAERAMPPAFRLICQTALAALREFQALRSEIAVHRHRARLCDMACGAMNRVAEGWYRAEKEFALEDEGPFEAVERLQSEITPLREQTRWRPMESAPRDGTTIALVGKYPHGVFTQVREPCLWMIKTGVKRGWWEGWGLSIEPAYWRPAACAPSPPQEPPT